jgi:hypothetical protein
MAEMMTWREKYLFNGTTICIVSAIEKREPVVLCDGKICEIQKYMGVHCSPITNRSGQWQYCMIVEATGVSNIFEKIIIEKENSTLLFRLAPTNNLTVLKKIIDACFSRRTKCLIDIRSKIMLETSIFIYDSMRKFVQGINHYDCSSYRIVVEKEYSLFRR